MKTLIVGAMFFALHLIVLGYMACGDDLEPRIEPDPGELR